MNDVSDIVLSSEELDSINLVSVKKAQAKAMLDRTDFPRDMESSVMAAFYKGAGDMLSEAQYAEKMWWKNVTEKYHLQGLSLSFDISTGKFSLYSAPTQE